MNNADFSERLHLIAMISTDIVFEYIAADGLFRLFDKTGESFSERVSTVFDFEQVFKEDFSVYKDDMDTFEQFCDNVKNGIDRAAFEFRLKDKDGIYRWYRVRMKAVFDDEHEHFVKMVGKMEDISDMKSVEKRLIEKAERDQLTKIYNKETTKRLIRNYLRTDERETFDAFIIIDIDDFKQINDTLGHLFGDSVLVDLSQEMQDLFRTNDVVGRTGGDEFIVFLRGMKHKSHIESKAKDICRIFDLLYAGEDGTKITGSLGISLFPQDGDTFDQLYLKADMALYASKHAGKSCYTFYNESQEKDQPVSSLPHVEQYRAGMDFLKPSQDIATTLTNYAFDISEQGVDDETILSLLTRAGKHFSLDRVTVYEYKQEKGGFYAAHQWCTKNIPSTLGNVITVTDAERFGTRMLFDSNSIYNSLFCKQGGCLYDAYMNKNGVKSCISGGSILGNKLFGMVAFEECTSPRTWSIEEAKAVKTIARIIFSYFLRAKKDEDC